MLDADTDFDLSAIMRRAHKAARGSQTRFYDRQVLPSYRDAFRRALADAWAQAKRERAAAQRPAAEIARDQERAALLFGAAMIDSTSHMISVVSRIEAGQPELRA